MADNVALPATGTGTPNVITAADNIGGVSYQRVKLVDGTEGATGNVVLGANGGLQVEGVETGVPLPVRGSSVQVRGSITRPSNTSPYSINDNISDSVSAPDAQYVDGCARVNGGSGSVVGLLLIDSSNHTTYGDFTVFLFDDAVTPANDNAIMAVTDADVENKLISVFELASTPEVPNTGTDAAGNCVYQWRNYPERGAVPFKCAGGSQKLYWLLRVNNAFVPVSGEKFTLVLGICKD
jgi:hypothetical protein